MTAVLVFLTQCFLLVVALVVVEEDEIRMALQPEEILKNLAFL